MKPFLHWDEDDLAPHFERSRIVTKREGELICDVRSTRNNIYILRSGLLRVSLLSAKGAERLLFYGKPGCIVGDTMCFGHKEDVAPSLRVIAVVQCQLISVAHDEFRAACIHNPELAMSLLARAYSKIASLIEQLEYASFHDTSSQVAALIHAFASERRDSGSSAGTMRLLHMTHQMMADVTGRTRVSVTYALNRLQHAGAIRLYRGRIEVLNEEVLASFNNEIERECQQHSRA